MTEPLFSIPPGLKVLPRAMARYFYLVDRPDTVYVEEGGLVFSSRNPLVLIDLGESVAYQDADGHPWRPDVSHLTASGKMLRSVILDNLPTHGNEHLIVSLEPLPEAQEKIHIN